MADEIFLQFPTSASTPDGTITVKGQSEVKGLTGAIQIQSFSVGIEDPTTIGSETGGAGAGKVKFSSLTVTKPVDSASTSLYQACAEGAHFPQVLLNVVKSAGTSVKSLNYLQYDFRLVYISSIQWSASSGEAAPLETLTLEFGALEVSYKVQDATGTPITTESGSWNVVTNAPTLTLPS